MSIQSIKPVPNAELANAIQRFYEAKLVVTSSSPQINGTMQSQQAGTMTNGSLMNHFDNGVAATLPKETDKKEDKRPVELANEQEYTIILSDVTNGTPADAVPPLTSFVHGAASYEQTADMMISEDE